MLIKYGNIDVTARLLDYKSSVSFAEGYLIGNAPVIQIDLKFDNYDGILDNLDINEYWEVQETNTSAKRYFKVYDQPEKYTKTLSLKLYDDNHLLDIPYDTKLEYPVTIKDQLDEIESLTGLIISRSNIPSNILSKDVAWYDSTIVIRNYLGWIAELFGANVFANGKKTIGFVPIAKTIFANTDTLTEYEKNELYKVTRVYYENGLDSLSCGDETGNTLYLDTNNLYIDNQEIIDGIYSSLNGLTFYSAKSIKMIAIDDLLPGKLVNYNNEFNFMTIDVSTSFKGGQFLLCDVDGTVTTKNEERVIKKISNSTRIRKLQIIQDQEKNRLDIIAKEQDGLNDRIGQLSVADREIEAIIKEKTTIETEDGNVSIVEYVENMKVDITGITNTIQTTSGNNLIRDSIGCFNDGSWDGDYNIDSTLETRSRNMYGYALLLKKSTLQQEITVANGVYTLSFTYKKLVNLARVTLTINGTEYILSNNDFTAFTKTFEVNDGQINVAFTCDTDNACPIINLMLNKGDQAMEWSLNPNETWGDTVKIGRGVRISSTGTDVVFVALADIIGFMDKQGNYITTFDDEGFVTNTAVIKNKATIVNLLIQEVNGQTIINKINPNEVNEVEVLKNGK